jgi:hypothetical protein
VGFTTPAEGDDAELGSKPAADVIDVRWNEGDAAEAATGEWIGRRRCKDGTPVLPERAVRAILTALKNLLACCSPSGKNPKPHREPPVSV